MPTYEVYNITDKASLTPATVGAALTAEGANQDFLPTADRRRVYSGNNTSAAAVAVELWIAGQTGHRIRFTPLTSFALRVEWTFISNTVIANSCGGSNLVGGYVSSAGVITLHANPTAVKIPNAATATFAVSSSGRDIYLIGTGNAGDTVGKWTCTVYVVSVVDLGA